MINKIKQKVINILPKEVKGIIKDIYYNKLLYNLHKLNNKIYYGTGDFFYSVGIETTTHCNLRCKFCPNSKYERGLFKNKKLMKESLFKKIIDELAKINYRGNILPYSFGEPITDNRMSNFVEYIKKKLPKARVVLNSNGILLNPKIYKKLIDSGVDSFLVSQYTSEMPENMKKVFAYLKTRPKKENKINYRIFGEELAISNRGGEVEVNRVWDKPICSYPHKTINIDYAGNVILCCNDYHSSIKFGNISNEKLIDIWNKADFKKIRKETMNKIYRLPICQKCVGLK